MINDAQKSIYDFFNMYTNISHTIIITYWTICMLASAYITYKNRSINRTVALLWKQMVNMHVKISFSIRRGLPAI